LEGVTLGLGVPEVEDVIDAPPDSVADALDVMVVEVDGNTEEVAEAVSESVLLNVLVGVREGVLELLGVPEGVTVFDALPVLDAEKPGASELVPVPVRDAVMVRVGVLDGVGCRCGGGEGGHPTNREVPSLGKVRRSNSRA
jgi:hypothetical protein